jgi:hypothetical protein
MSIARSIDHVSAVAVSRSGKNADWWDWECGALKIRITRGDIGN